MLYKSHLLTVLTVHKQYRWSRFIELRFVEFPSWIIILFIALERSYTKLNVRYITAIYEYVMYALRHKEFPFHVYKQHRHHQKYSVFRSHLTNTPYCISYVIFQMSIWELDFIAEWSHRTWWSAQPPSSQGASRLAGATLRMLVRYTLRCNIDFAKQSFWRRAM